MIVDDTVVRIVDRHGLERSTSTIVMLDNIDTYVVELAKQLNVATDEVYRLRAEVFQLEKAKHALLELCDTINEVMDWVME